MNGTTRSTLARGFTLLELMIVLVIIGVLGAVVGFNLMGAAEKAKISATKTTMDVTKQALTQYAASYNYYPPSNLGLNILIADRILNEYPKDGWGRELEYASPTARSVNGYELISAGADGQFNTADDIVMMPTEN